MKSVTKILMAVAGAVTLALQNPAVQQFLVNLIQTHPHVASVVGGVATISALAHNPKA